MSKGHGRKRFQRTPDYRSPLRFDGNEEALREHRELELLRAAALGPGGRRKRLLRRRQRKLDSLEGQQG